MHRTELWTTRLFSFIPTLLDVAKQKRNREERSKKRVAHPNAWDVALGFCSLQNFTSSADGPYMPGISTSKQA